MLSMLSCIPSTIDSSIPDTDKRYRVSLIAFQSSTAKAYGFVLLLFDLASLAQPIKGSMLNRA